MKEEDRRRMGDLLKLQTDFIAHPGPLRTVVLGIVVEDGRTRRDVKRG